MDVCGLGDRNTEAITLDRYLPTGDWMAGSKDPEFVRFVRIQRNHRPSTHPKELLHWHLAAAEHHGELDLDMLDLGFIGHWNAPSDSALVEPERVAGA